MKQKKDLVQMLVITVIVLVYWRLSIDMSRLSDQTVPRLSFPHSCLNLLTSQYVQCCVCVCAHMCVFLWCSSIG